jgi:hypothetical protein
MHSIYMYIYIDIYMYMYEHQCRSLPVQLRLGLLRSALVTVTPVRVVPVALVVPARVLTCVPAYMSMCGDDGND